MNPHSWYEENREAFVARLLEGREESCFEDHLVRCPDCVRAIEEIERDLSWLPLAVRPVAPRPGFTRQVTVAVLDHELRPWWRRWSEPLAVAALLTLAVGLGWMGRRSSTLASELATLRTRLSAASSSLGIQVDRTRIAQASVSGPGYNGGLMVFADTTAGQWRIVVHGLPAAPAGERYHFWFVCPNGMVKGAVLDVDADSPAILTLTPPLPTTFGPVQGAVITMEAGNVAEPHGKEVLSLKL